MVEGGKISPSTPFISSPHPAGPGGSPVLVKHELINPAAAGLVSEVILYLGHT